MTDLFDAAADRLAFGSGRPRSQERAEVIAPTPTTAGLPLLAAGSNTCSQADDDGPNPD